MTARPPASSVDLTVSSMASSRGAALSDRTVPRRAPSSVTSHSTKHTRRHHRTSRSHHGGGSSSNALAPSQNEFPNFAHTGDVEIVVNCEGQERRYLLHRLILARCSGWFEASTSERWDGMAAADAAGSSPDGTLAIPGQQQHQHRQQAPGILQIQAAEEGRWPGSAMTVAEMGVNGVSHVNGMQAANNNGGGGGKSLWRYELDYGDDTDDVPMLVRKTNRRSLFGGGDSSPQPRPPAARSKPPTSSNGFFRSITAMQSVVNAPSVVSSSAAGGQSQVSEAANDTIRDYDNLFRIFYNYPPNLDAVSITEAYVQCKTLLTLADMYDALEVVGPRVDHHLLQFQGRLWKQIAKYPPSYLKLGYLSRSRTIFGEALTHVVGQWPAGQAQLRSASRPVLDLIEDKADDLDELRARLEGQLFRLTIVNSRGDRASPANPNSLDWLAVCLFRHWLAEHLPPAPPPISAGLGTTANPNPTGGKSVSFNPQTMTNGRPNSTHGPMLANESALSAGAVTVTSPTATSMTGGGGFGGAGSLSQSGVADSALAPRSSLVPASGRAFRLLGLAGQAYLPHDELKKHLKLHLESQLYDKTQLRRFEKRIDDLKLQAQAVVRPLTRNALQLDVGGGGGGSGGLGYLTCAGVGEGEWPW